MRRDRGQPRLPPEVLEEVQRVLAGQERPPMSSLLERLEAFALVRGLRPPARATLYQLMSTMPAGSYAIAALPAGVGETLYNLDESGEVPGHQLAFHCFNYGGLDALSFAAGLPCWRSIKRPACAVGERGAAAYSTRCSRCVGSDDVSPYRPSRDVDFGVRDASDLEDVVSQLGRAARDWERVKRFFLARVGQLLVPPGEPLEIQRLRVDVGP